MTQTLSQLYREIRQSLEPVTHSPAQAKAEADWMLRALLSVSPEERYTQADRPVSASESERLHDLLQLRVEKRIPIQYLLHEAWFFGLRFYVNPHVLIPRPETELLVEEALKVAKPGMRILDVGTGPGTIALALASRLGGDVEIVGVDVSDKALQVAELNRKRFETNVRFICSDLFSALSDDEPFDVIVSNPPYIDPALKPTLSPEVLWHEPEQALFPPVSDACHFYRRLAKEGKVYLKPGGSLLMEIGEGMGAAVQELLTAERFSSVERLPDYADIERIVKASGK